LIVSILTVGQRTRKERKFPFLLQTETNNKKRNAKGGGGEKEGKKLVIGEDNRLVVPQRKGGRERERGREYP
jgi:hypothetical protein